MRTVLTGYLKPEEKRENYTRWYRYCCHTSIKRLEIFLTITTLLGTYVHALQLTSYYLYPHLLSAAVTMQTWAAHPIERERERESACLVSKMGFGRDLRNSHEGLMKLQDWELKLLETVKRFMTLRVKSDKEYASLLLNISQQVDKHDNSSQIHYVSTVSKVMAHSCIMGRQVELMFYVFYMVRTIHSATCSLCFCLAFSISVNLFVCFSHTFLILSFVSLCVGFVISRGLTWFSRRSSWARSWSAMLRSWTQGLSTASHWWSKTSSRWRRATKASTSRSSLRCTRWAFI